ncbi:cytidine deaminase [Streptococcus pneumoniae]|nr:cytidine deaminase [Streptococcus pneumoniae]VKY30300.1 cytidine deaminase [Streptococcus pneumoniae]VMB20328.1 cytidine deaminase [Streptococcus pneumoniae]VNJ45589.1 cytidine deaminase [Streptococcus pneumoniae]VNR47525.1 cytidine deaminase [Streptococcus pneumoniae]
MTVINKFVLMEQAKKVLKNAYCPYSKFPIGAAILFKDGKVITGANIENVSFGVTNCAERSAIFYGASQGYRKGDILAIAVAGETEDYLPPCNICRQVMVEFCEPDTLVFLLNGKGNILELRLEELVPYSFSSLEM